MLSASQHQFCLLEKAACFGGTQNQCLFISNKRHKNVAFIPSVLVEVVLFHRDTIFLSGKLLIFSYPSVLTCVLGAQKNSLIETVLLSTHNIPFS